MTMRIMLLSKTPASLGCEVPCRAGCAAGQEFADRRQAMKPRTFARQMWRKRVGVELKHSTPNSRRMMMLQLPPGSNWSQLESERFTSPQDFASLLSFGPRFSDCGIVDLCRRLAAQVSQLSDLGSIPIARSIKPVDAVGFTGFHSLNWPTTAG